MRKIIAYICDMLFNQIIGQEHIKNHLLASAKNGRIPHAQLFIGKEGSGTLPVAIAYAQFLLSHFSDNPEVSELKVDKLQHPDLHFAFPVTTNDSVKKHPEVIYFYLNGEILLKINLMGVSLIGCNLLV